MAANTITSFFGINNVTDPLRLGLGWLTAAENVVVTDAGAIEKREGYTRVRPGDFSGAYTTADFQRGYLVEGSTLTTFDGGVLISGLADLPVYWAEVNGRVFFNNGVDSGIIEPDNSVSLWREAEIVGGDGFYGDDGTLLDEILSSLPTGTDVIQFWGGRMYACQYFPTEDQTAVWFSEPLGFHLFRLDESFLLISGRVSMLAPHSDALVIGTDKEIYAYADEKLQRIADYGVVPGQHWVADGERILFWTKRGTCSALPFKNLTERQVSMAPGSSACGAVIHSRGQKRYLVTVKQGGAAFNQR